MKRTGKFSKVIVHYVDDCTPKLALFDNVDKGEDWIFKFLLRNQNIDPNGTYIDSIFINGMLVYNMIEIGVDESDYYDER